MNAVVDRLFRRNKAGQSVVVHLRPCRAILPGIRAAGLPEKIKVRLVTVRLQTGELEVLATNLLDKNIYETEAFGELYWIRWGIEGYYHLLIPSCLQDEIKARRNLRLWRGSPQTRAALIRSDSSEAHIRSDLQRASNEARGANNKRINLILKATWNQEPFGPGELYRAFDRIGSAIFACDHFLEQLGISAHRSAPTRAGRVLAAPGQRATSEPSDILSRHPTSHDRSAVEPRADPSGARQAPAMVRRRACQRPSES
jgi:hypothetical protein